MKPLLIAVVPVRVLVLWFSVDALIGPVVWGLYSVGPASSTTHPMLSLTFPIIYKQTISVGYSYNFRKCPIVCSWVNPLYGTNSDSDKLVQTQTVTNLYKHRHRTWGHDKFQNIYTFCWSHGIVKTKKIHYRFQKWNFHALNFIYYSETRSERFCSY